MEGIIVSEMDYIPCTDVGSSVMLLGVASGSDPVGRSLGPGFNESSWQDSLGRDMIEDYLRFQYFARAKFSCVVSSE